MSEEFNWQAFLGAAPDTFDEGDIICHLEKEGVSFGVQYMISHGALLIVSNDPAKSDDGNCQMKKLKDEKFIRMASVRNQDYETDFFRKNNNQAMELIDRTNGVSLSAKDKIRLPRLNESSDLETLILVQNILKERYHVDTQRSGVLT
jgi:hypothetical protein